MQRSENNISDEDMEEGELPPSPGIVSDEENNEMEIKKNNEYEDYKIAKKMPAAKLRGAEEADVISNSYHVDLVSLPPQIYQYHIDIYNISIRKERNLSIGGSSDFAVQTRRRACHRLFEIFRKTLLPMYDMHTLIYDGGNVFYSKVLIDEISEEVKLAVKRTDKVVKEDRYIEGYISKNCTEILFKIKYTGPVKLNLKGSQEEMNSTTHFMELLTSAELNYRERHYQYKNKAYEKEGGKEEVKLGEGKLVKPGLRKSCRLVGDENCPEALLQIAPKKSPFLQGLDMIPFLCEVLKCDKDKLDNALLQKHGAALANTQIKDLWVRTKHLSPNKDIVVKCLAKTDAYKTTFKNKDGEQQSVYDYFKIEKKFALRYPHLPLVVQSRGDSVSFFPMEVLRIREGQRVTTAKATPALAEKMIKECQIKPTDMVAMIADQMEKVKLNNEDGKINKYMEAFGVRISSRPLEVSAKRLHAPAIRFANQAVEPRGANLQWGKLAGKEIFMRPAIQKKTFFLISFDRAVQEDAAYTFVDKLCKVGQAHGMQMNSRNSEFKDLSSEDIHTLEEHIRNWAEKASLIFAITKSKLDPVHDTLKLLEAKYGVVTQNVSKLTMQKALGEQGSYMVLQNLILKTNLKMGGINFVLEAGRDLMRQPEMSRNELFSKNRMFFGFDVSHAGPQSFAERKLGVVQSEPSVVGMSYSLSSATEIRGTYWMQSPGLANITAIKNNAIIALENFRNHNGFLPEEIIVYRGGVSEGEYQMVVKEMTDFFEAFEKVRDPKSSRRYNPSLTCIVICTNSNYRIFPKIMNAGDTAAYQNVRPGTVVDHEITHPGLNEFILVPQKALQGTARPIRCTVVYAQQGEMGKIMDMDQIELVTNSLCYGHQVVCGSTGVPSLIYAATNITKRGRNNWKADNFGEHDSSSVASGHSREKWNHNGSDNFYEAMSESLAPKVNCHYWA